jgi:hypothetical protein
MAHKLAVSCVYALYLLLMSERNRKKELPLLMRIHMPMESLDIMGQFTGQGHNPCSAFHKYHPNNITGRLLASKTNCKTASVRKTSWAMGYNKPSQQFQLDPECRGLI